MFLYCFNSFDINVPSLRPLSVSFSPPSSSDSLNISNQCFSPVLYRSIPSSGSAPQPGHLLLIWDYVFSAAVLHLVLYANMCTSVQVAPPVLVCLPMHIIKKISILRLLYKELQDSLCLKVCLTSESRSRTRTGTSTSTADDMFNFYASCRHVLKLKSKLVICISILGSN